MSSERDLPRTEERNPASEGLDLCGGAEQVRLFLEDQRAAFDAVALVSAELDRAIDAIAEVLSTGGRLVYGGAGTSGRLGVLDASECPPTFSSDPEQVVGLIAGGDRALRHPIEAAEDSPEDGAAALRAIALRRGDLFLGITASGRTPWVRGALEYARSVGARTGLLCCSPPPAELVVDHLLHLPTGPELVTGSTRLKAGTATKLALNALTTLAFVRLGKVYGNLMVDVKATNAKLRARAQRIVVQATQCSPERAAALLNEAGGRVKLAIVMQLLALDAADAEAQLALHRGHIRNTLRAARGGA
ncbi:MAG: N-acetylmuramic acid 6-phosphate etherase [Planctomycetes bacterium]|nr:N-acetylmuramic acid 6-phosphate etherase [Planctomycetota bacterium]